MNGFLSILGFVALFSLWFLLHKLCITICIGHLFIGIHFLWCISPLELRISRAYTIILSICSLSQWFSKFSMCYAQPQSFWLSRSGKISSGRWHLSWDLKNEKESNPMGVEGNSGAGNSRHKYSELRKVLCCLSNRREAGMAETWWVFIESLYIPQMYNFK